MKKIKRDSILYAHVQKINQKWIESEMKRLGYPATRGKSEFVDSLLSRARSRKSA